MQQQQQLLASTKLSSLIPYFIHHKSLKLTKALKIPTVRQMQEKILSSETKTNKF